jgi:hypothetical protein
MKDIDKGFKEAIKKLQALAGKTLQVGILSDAGVNEKTGTLIAEYAYANEFGTKDIPARSFIGSTCDEQFQKWDAMVDKMKIDPSYSVERLLGTLGEQVVGDIKEKIGSNIQPSNSDATIAKKKSSRTLIDTGIMRRAIKYKIVDK